jgi:hypothetical protein
MNNESLKPNKIEDIVFRMEEYLSEIRKMEKDESIDFLNFLDSYIKEYFTIELNELDIKKLAVELTDVIYIKISNIQMRDIYTDGYFGIVVASLYWELKKKGILCFYIIDNHIRDDRFKLAVELFGSSGFSVIYPYLDEKLDYSEKYTNLPPLDYKKVVEKIDEAKSNGRHILYVEKDDSINYLKNVFNLAEDLQSKYQCVFRNEASSELKGAKWLTGTFADWLN